MKMIQVLVLALLLFSFGVPDSVYCDENVDHAERCMRLIGTGSFGMSSRSVYGNWVGSISSPEQAAQARDDLLHQLAYMVENSKQHLLEGIPVEGGGGIDDLGLAISYLRIKEAVPSLKKGIQDETFPMVVRLRLCRALADLQHSDASKFPVPILKEQIEGDVVWLAEEAMAVFKPLMDPDQLDYLDKYIETRNERGREWGAVVLQAGMARTCLVAKELAKLNEDERYVEVCKRLANSTAYGFTKRWYVDVVRELETGRRKSLAAQALRPLLDEYTEKGRGEIPEEAWTRSRIRIMNDGAHQN